MRWKDFDSTFKACSRERRIEIFANRTNPPPLGHYRPKIEFTETSSFDPHINGEHETEKEALEKKFELAK